MSKRLRDHTDEELQAELQRRHPLEEKNMGREVTDEPGGAIPIKDPTEGLSNSSEDRQREYEESREYEGDAEEEDQDDDEEEEDDEDGEPPMTKADDVV